MSTFTRNSIAYRKDGTLINGSEKDSTHSAFSRWSIQQSFNPSACGDSSARRWSEVFLISMNSGICKISPPQLMAQRSLKA